MEAWTEPRATDALVAPKRTTPFCKIDLRTGGSFTSACVRPRAATSGAWASIREIRRAFAPRLHRQLCGCARPIRPSRATSGMSASHPAETLVTGELEEHEGKTILTLRHAIPDRVRSAKGSRARMERDAGAACCSIAIESVTHLNGEKSC